MVSYTKAPSNLLERCLIHTVDKHSYINLTKENSEDMFSPFAKYTPSEKRSIKKR